MLDLSDAEHERGVLRGFESRMRHFTLVVHGPTPTATINPKRETRALLSSMNIFLLPIEVGRF